jgi:chorismate mutase
MQVLETAQALAASGRVSAFRAGIWKPRTRPGSFEGIGGTALDWLAAARAATGLPIMTEVANAQHVEACLKAGFDAVWIGARTTVNPFYVQEIAEALRGVDVPVWVKNPIHSDVGLWIGALERLDKVGIRHLAAVHRGFYADRPEPFRNDPKWELSFALRTRVPDVPIVCDPSHIAGKRNLVEQVAQTAMDLQLDGLMIEVHPTPEKALSDADQQLTPSALVSLLERLEMRNQLPADPQALTQLADLRGTLDELDSELVQLLQQRMETVASIGDLKAEHAMTVFQLDRFSHIFKARGEEAKNLGVHPGLIEELFQVVHKYSVQKQIEVRKDRTPEADSERS